VKFKSKSAKNAEKRIGKILNTTANFVFRPHGKFETWIEGQFLLTEVTGPWNVELVDYWSHQALALARQFSKERPYVSITVVHESILCPPEALEKIALATQYANDHLTCLGHCVVAGSDVDGRDLVRFLYEKIRLEHIFEDLEEAKSWAEELVKEDSLKRS
jgi:hypothetical protein